MSPDDMVARAVAARDAGIDGLYVGDHHAVESGYPQNNVILGRLLAEWPGDIGAVYIVPVWNPVLLAEQIGTLARMTRGRFVFQAALGDGRAQFAAMGARLDHRVEQFEARVPLIRRLLDGEKVTNDLLGIEAARIEAVDSVVFWVAGHSPSAIERAARMAEGWVAPPGISDEAAGTLAARYRRACEAEGVEPGDVAIRRDVFVGNDPNEAERMLREAMETGYRGFERDFLVTGDAGQVADHVASLGKAGFTEVVVRQFVPEQGRALESIGRMRDVRRELG